MSHGVAENPNGNDKVTPISKGRQRTPPQARWKTGRSLVVYDRQSFNH